MTKVFEVRYKLFFSVLAVAILCWLLANPIFSYAAKSTAATGFSLAFPIKKCEIVFHAEQSELSLTSRVHRVGEMFSLPPIPIKNGYSFDGWYTERSGGKKVTPRTIITEDMNLYVRWKKNDFEVDYDIKGLPILMYHQFYDPEKGETPVYGLEGNWMEVSMLESHLDYFNSEEYYYPTWDEVDYYLDGKIDLPPLSVVICVDDGHTSYFDYCIPLSEEYEIPTTGYIITKNIQNDKVMKYADNKYVNLQSHTDEMHVRGNYGQGLITSSLYEDATSDLIISTKKLGNKDALAYPFGHRNEFAKQVVKDVGFKMAFTTDYGLVYPGMDKYELPRIRINSYNTVEDLIYMLEANEDEYSEEYSWDYEEPSENEYLDDYYEPSENEYLDDYYEPSENEFLDNYYEPSNNEHIDEFSGDSNESPYS